MRSISHWSPRYIKDRICLLFYEKRHPEHPWLTQKAINILESYLKESDEGLEFGSGRSTLWFINRIKVLTSVEHDPAWYSIIDEKLKEKTLSNIRYLLIEKDQPESKGGESKYVKVAQQFPSNSLDFVLVDGVYRGECAIASIEALKPGGMLIIDNVNWYLPSSTFSPASRTVEQGPVSGEWERFQKRVSSWRCIWTSNGVTDTVIYFKPCSP